MMPRQVDRRHPYSDIFVSMLYTVFCVVKQDKAEKVVRDAAAAGANIILLQVHPFLAPSPATC